MTDDEILNGILKHEGGYVDHPNDRGGCTNFGITLRTLEQWRGQPVTCDDVRSLSQDEAKAIYRARYIRPFDALGLPPKLKAQVVDIAVNSGVTTARGLLAQAQKQNARPVDVQLVIERLRYYAKIVKGRPNQSVFLLGWVNRAVSFLAIALFILTATTTASSPQPEGSWGRELYRPVGTVRPAWSRTAGMTGSDCLGVVIARGTVSQADHEAAEGFANIGESFGLSMRPQSPWYLRVLELRGKSVEVVLRPVPARELETIR